MVLQCLETRPRVHTFTSAISQHCWHSWIIWSVSPLYLVVLNWVFPFEVYLSDWVFKDLRTLDVCLAMGYPWWQWDVLLIHLMYVWWSTCGFRDLGNLCIGVGTSFCLDSPVETLRHSLKFFVLDWTWWIWIVWCISYNQAHGYSWWHWSI